MSSFIIIIIIIKFIRITVGTIIIIIRILKSSNTARENSLLYLISIFLISHFYHHNKLTKYCTVTLITITIYVTITIIFTNAGIIILYYNYTIVISILSYIHYHQSSGYHHFNNWNNSFLSRFIIIFLVTIIATYVIIEPIS